LKYAFYYLVFGILYSIKHHTFKDLFRGIRDGLLRLPEVLRGRQVVSPEAMKMLESKPFEKALIGYGSFDTIKKWITGKR